VEGKKGFSKQIWSSSKPTRPNSNKWLLENTSAPCPTHFPKALFN
jgi:hypothetical protein